MEEGRRRVWLEALGIPRWERRADAPAPQLGPAEGTEVAPVGAEEPATAPQAGDEPASSESRAGEGGAAEGAPGAPEEPIVPAPDPVARLDWEPLAARVAECTACDLHQSRTQTVFGVGDRAADWLVVGEAPGAEEDRRGEPFVGRAGELLDAMLVALGLARGSGVYIANILKCRPPRNRDPQPAEVAACSPYLRRQIELIDPGVILAVGRIAATNLLGREARLGELRGKVHAHPETGTPVVVTYHPAYLLRNPADKARAWADLKLARQTLAEHRGDA
ncbi:DNA polymerase [Thiohalospira halophila DSM 15071]|uniref:Type-4 uracil-DNA glycosylase n=1 Tax=Thiohalospira halophila DSM 15071 TaxID=1123397 RepID=A0A1I1QMI9_9GAMM|nr:uracil-DNA glycosylase [Thiohalospira halophila]SFD19290.1 DNA polymerase [Thiohalospira halophila DSM 15071]